MSLATDEHCRDRPLTGRFVLFCLIGFFAAISVANGIMIRAAVTTFGGVETSSSYQAGLVFSRETAAAHAQDELRWQVRADIQPLSGKTLVAIDARDADGRPVSGLQASARLAHPTDRRGDKAVTLSEGTSGHFHGTTEAITGQWDVVIELSRDGERLFRSRNRIVLR